MPSTNIRRLSPMALLVWTLSLFHLATAYVVTADMAAANDNKNVAASLVTRQTTQANGFASAICMEYASVANYSTIAANATTRAAFNLASPHGGLFNQQYLNGFLAKLPSFQFDKTINDECGNLTAIAIAGVASNFSMGIVADFKISAAGVATTAGGWTMLAAVLIATLGVMA